MPVGQNFVSQLKKVRVSKKTITRSIRDLMMDFQATKIVIPSYQRTFVWDLSKQCRFIESVFMDIPIPPLFFLEKFDDESDTTVFEIIDGVQRLTTLGNFVNGTLKLSNLDNLPDLNQAVFSSLPSNISGLFFERQINTIVIESDTHPEIQFEVFGRLNMGSVSLNAQELRNCMFHGDFNDFLIDCSKNSIYRKLLEPFPKLQPPKAGKPDKNRMLDVELVLRFFALIELYNPETKKYPESRGETLNEYMRKAIKDPNSISSKQMLENLLIKVCTMVEMTFQEKQFRSFKIKKDNADFTRTLNAAIFDVQMLGFVDYQIDDILDKTELIYEAFLDLCCYDRNFIDAISRSTNSKVNERIGIWKNQINLIIEDPQTYYEIYNLKKQLFASAPICNSSNIKIPTLEEADVCDGKLYHRAFSSKLTNGKNGSSERSRGICILLENQEIKFDTHKDALQFVVQRIAKKISNDSYDISRLKTLSYIGTQDDLLMIQGEKHLKTFGHLENDVGELIYINLAGTKGENSKKIEDLASLFSFLSDLKILG